MLVFGCRMADVSVRRYFMIAMLPPALAAGIPAVALALIVRYLPDVNWAQLIAYGGVYSVLFCISFCVIVEVPEPVRRRLRSSRPAAAVEPAKEAA